MTQCFTLTDRNLLNAGNQRDLIIFSEHMYVQRPYGQCEIMVAQVVVQNRHSMPHKNDPETLLTLVA